MTLLKTLKILKYILLAWVVIHSIRAVVVLSLFMVEAPGFDIIGGSMIAVVTGVIMYRVIDQELNKAKQSSGREL